MQRQAPNLVVNDYLSAKKDLEYREFAYKSATTDDSRRIRKKLLDEARKIVSDYERKYKFTSS